MSPFLRTGTTMADFQTSGKIPVDNDSLKIKASASNTAIGDFFNVVAEIWSWPTTTLCGSELIMHFTSFTDTWRKLKRFS